MELLKSPTDNLYKFVALSGVAVFALMLVLAHQTVSRTNEEHIRLTAKMDRHNWWFDITDARLQKLEAGLDTFTEEKLYKELGDEKYNKLITDFSEMNADKERLKLLEWQMTVFPIIYAIIALVAVVVACGGFYLWYYRLQCFLDKKLEMEVANLNDSQPTTTNQEGAV